MIIHDVEQGTPEWHELRTGKFTASNFHILVGKTTNKGYNDLINQIAFERLSGEYEETYKNEWMQRGIDLEPEARLEYQLLNETSVDTVGFVELTDWVGVSPDGLIGEEGGLEIKCPKASTLMDLHLDGKVANNYYWQMQGSLYVTGRKWWDYFVYHPKLKPFQKRIVRCEEDIESLEKSIEQAISLVNHRMELFK